MKRLKRYKVKVFTKMRDPFSLMYSGGERTFIVNGRLTKTEAVKTIRRMKDIYPAHFKYRLVRSRKKGVNGIAFALGLVLLVFCIAIANATPDLFSLTESVENLIRVGFLALGLFGLVVALIKD
jgi:hypothetical protein